MSAHHLILGVDIGSVAIAVVALNSSQQVLQRIYEFHHGKPAPTLEKILSRFDLGAVGGIAATAETPPILKAARRYDSRVAVITAANHFHEKIGSILVQKRR